MNRFELCRVTTGKVEYFDILIDGRPLAEYFAGPLGAVPDSISPLGPLGAEIKQYRQEQFERFLLERDPDLHEGRNSILVCPLCGDLGCGAYSARFQQEGDVIKWSEFGYENNYDPASVELDRFKLMSSFVFLWNEYSAELRRYLGA